MAAYKQYTDDQLLLLLKQGDSRAFDEIYHRYWKLLFGIAANKLDDIADAEEVVQDVFADLWKRQTQVAISKSLKSYLAGAVKFKVYSTLARRYRLKQNKAQLAEQTSSDTALPVDELYRIKQLEEELTRASNDLPERCRLIYQLSRQEGYSNKQIAYQLNISEKTVESQITRALKQLRLALQSMLSMF